MESFVLWVEHEGAVYTLPLATGLATLARIRQARGDTAGALDTIAEAERVTPGPDQEQARRKAVPLGAAVRTNV